MKYTIVPTTLLVALIAVACTGGGSGPSPSGSPSPTASPTVSPSPTFGEGEISHPTGAGELILQMETGGGFVPMDFFVTQAPSFSLYGDGVVILRPTQEQGRVTAPGEMPPFWQGKLTEEQVQALLRFALGQGRLLDAREHYPQNSCADCPSTFFKINAAGLEKSVSIDALGVDPTGGDVTDRTGFVALAETLAGFEQRAMAGELGEIVTYDPALYRAVLIEAQPEQGEATEWPWTDVAVEDFKAADADAFWRAAVLTREQVALLIEVPSGGTVGILVEAPDGKVWSVGVRPLLPDELAAEAEG